MNRIANGAAADRRDLFSESASRLGMNPAIVEKDFWVCWILKQIFAEPALKDHMVFKGGTSLSKVYGLIDRFSEDIDLILDWRLLGYGTEHGSDPYKASTSKTQQSRYNQEMNAKAAGRYADVPGFCKAAKLDEIQKHTYVLMPGRYVGAEAIEDDGEPFEEKMAQLAATLREQQAEAARQDTAIAANQKELGYGK